MLQDLKPGSAPMDLLEAALKEAVYPDEPVVIKLMIFLYAYDPKYRDPDEFQVTSFPYISTHLSCHVITIRYAARLYALGASVSWHLLENCQQRAEHGA